MDNKKHNFIVFLLGMFAGRYGVPAIIHVLYLSTIVGLWITLHH